MFDWDRLKAYLVLQVSGDDLSFDVLRHEMAAVLNRRRLTGQDEGMTSFNTDQLIWLSASIPAGSPVLSMFIGATVISALIDGRYGIYDEAKACGAIAWPWMSWADGFAGDVADLRAKLTVMPALRERSGAVCLALRSSPQCVDGQLVADFRRQDTAMVYHRLLRLAVDAGGPDLPALAVRELEHLRDQPEVLFASDVDATLAMLVRASGRGDLDGLLAAYGEAASDLTRAAWARNALAAGNPREALRILKDIRLLSQAWPEGSVVACAAHLELGEIEQAGRIAPLIDDPIRRLMVQVRVAQAQGDAGREAEALDHLHAADPSDPSVALQLLGALHRAGRAQDARMVAAEIQERFPDQPQLLGVARRFLGR